MTAPDFASWGVRPWTAPQLKAYITWRVATLEVEMRTGRHACGSTFAGMIARRLNDVCGGDNNRHTVMRYLIGVGSVKQNNVAQAMVLTDWIGSSVAVYAEAARVLAEDNAGKHVGRLL